MTHSLCPVEEASVILVQERTKSTPVKVIRVKLEKAELRNYIVGKLSQYADLHDFIYVRQFVF